MNSSFYDMWNVHYIQQQAQLQAQQHHYQQQKQVGDTVRKLQDFLDSYAKIEPQYQGGALSDCCAVIASYIASHKN